MPFHLSPTHHLFRCICADIPCALVNFVFYCVCHPIIAVTVETTYSGITILQGDNVTLSCSPSKPNIALQWSYNGRNINNSPQYQFNPPLLNHNLTIFNANSSNSGSYVCAIVLPNIQETIVLTVVASKCDCIASMNF